MKESILKTDNNLVFRETFGSEDLVRANGWTASFSGTLPTAFTNGVMTFNNASNSMQLFMNLKGTYSVRIRYASTFIGESSLPIVDFRDNGANSPSRTGLIYGNTPILLAPSSGTAYINGVASTVLSSATQEIVISGMTIDAVMIILGKFSGSSSYWDGNTWELFEIYKGTLSANEVKNLYENRQNRELQNSNGSVYNEILRVDARNGVISNKYSGSPYVELLSNGGFTSDAVWTKGTGWSIANNVATKVAGTASNLAQAATAVSRVYRVVFTVSNYGGGTINAQLSGGGGGTGTSRNANGTYIQDITSGSSAGGNFYLVASSDFAGNISNVSCKELIPSVTPTAVSVVRSGNVYAMSFTGATSAITCGSYDTLVGDKTFIAWCKVKSATGSRRIFSNSQFMIGYTATDQFYNSRNASLSPFSATSAAKRDWVMLVVTSTSTGISNLFVNGALSGTANQSGGTPVAGTAMIIGNSATEWNGLLSNVRVVDGILSTQEIAQLWQNEKSLYNL